MAASTAAIALLALLAASAAPSAVVAHGTNPSNWDMYLHDPYYFPTIDCPEHPHTLCDFYFDGYENCLPTFYLDDGVTSGDHALIPSQRSTLNWVGDMTYFAPGVKDYKTGAFVLANTRNGTLLKYPSGTYDECAAKDTFDQFYLNAKTDAISHIYARSWSPVGDRTRCFWEKKCVFLPFSGAWIQGTPINLNMRDNHTDYEYQRRCVVFKTAQ